MPETEPARVSLFMGKGGVGKTTMAAAFALDRADAGERVLLAGVVSADEIERRLREERGEAVPDGNLDFAQVDPDELVDEIVRRLTRLGPIGAVVTNHPGYDALLDIVPGIRELAVLNLVYNRALEGDEDGEPYDRVILDGAATGHGVHLLEAPKKARRLLVGDLRERAREIDRFLKDPAHCEVVLVTLPEEMPVNETIQLAGALRERGFPVEDVVVNKWLPDVFTDEDVAGVLETLEADADARADLAAALPEAEGPRPGVDAWVKALGHVGAQRAENETFLRTLEGLDAEVTRVPLVPEPDGRLGAVASALRERAGGREAVP